MKAFTTIAALSALASASYAATVTLKETPCLDPTTQLETFTIDTDKLVVKKLDSVCGLKITSASGADVNSIVCQAYIDDQGQKIGSAKFTFASQALIATNPVQEGSIRCDTSGNATTTTTGTGAPSSTLASVVSVGTGGPTPSGNATVPSATQTPTQPSGTSTGNPVPTGAAARMGWSLGAGVVAAGFAVLLL